MDNIKISLCLCGEFTTAKILDLLNEADFAGKCTRRPEGLNNQ